MLSLENKTILKEAFSLDTIKDVDKFLSDILFNAEKGLKAGSSIWFILNTERINKGLKPIITNNRVNRCLI